VRCRAAAPSATSCAALRPPRRPAPSPCRVTASWVHLRGRESGPGLPAAAARQAPSALGAGRCRLALTAGAQPMPHGSLVLGSVGMWTGGHVAVWWQLVWAYDLIVQGGQRAGAAVGWVYNQLRHVFAVIKHSILVRVQGVTSRCKPAIGQATVSNVIRAMGGA
jgi:hypothetical protein